MKPTRTDLEAAIINWAGGQTNLIISAKEIAYQIEKSIYLETSVIINDSFVAKQFAAFLREISHKLEEKTNV